MNPLFTLTALICLVAYLLGSIPFGLLLTRKAGINLREVGSGNIGATNVMRTGNKKLAIATLLLDAFKGWLAVFVAPNLYFLLGSQFIPGLNILPVHVVYAAGLAAMLGHVFPVWLKFRGGKGIATFFGILLAISYGVFAVTAINWLLFFRFRRISSLASLISSFFAPFYAWAFVNSVAAAFIALATALIFFTHRANIRRLLRHEEPSFPVKSAEKPLA